MSAHIVEGNGYVVFHGKPEPGQWIAGIVLSAIGLWLVVQVSRAMSASWAATHAAWTAYVPGVLFWGAVSLAFLLPGIGLLFYRRAVRVDVEARQVAEQRTVLGMGRTRVYPLGTFKKIVVARRAVTRRRGGQRVGSAHSRRTYRYFAAELTPPAGKPLAFVTDASDAPVRDAAARLATATGLAVDDATGREMFA